MKSQTKEGLLKDHIFWAQDKDVCDQCVRPWHDGICTCGSSNNPKIKDVRDIALTLINAGINLDHL